MLFTHYILLRLQVLVNISYINYCFDVLKQTIALFEKLCEMRNPNNLTMCLYMIILKILSSLVCNFSYQQDLLEISQHNCSFKLFCKLIPIGEFIIPVGICLYITDSFNTLAGTSPSLEQLLPFSYLLILSSETGSNLLTRLQNCLRWFFYDVDVTFIVSVYVI